MSTTTVGVDSSIDNYSIPPLSLGEVIAIALGSIVGGVVICIGCACFIKALVLEQEVVLEGPAVERRLRGIDLSRSKLSASSTAAIGEHLPAPISYLPISNN